MVLPTLLAACSQAASPIETARFEYDFSMGELQWVAGFADYPAGQGGSYELASGLRPRPAPLDTTRLSMFISGNNHSDDLFMFLTRRVEGLRPGTRYRVTLTVEFATDVPRGCVGTGGSAGDGVIVKVGAASIEPEARVDSDGYLRMSIDKGMQSQGGANAVVVGNVANSTDCEQNIRRFELKQLGGSSGVDVVADAQGALWLLVGTDSGFESTTSLYYTRITATIVPA